MDVDSSTRPQPFDVLITWVNGADPLWRAIRALHQGEVHLQQTLSTSNVEGRFRDNGELRYLLYSLRAFCTGLRRIFLVTAGQRPHFLDEFPEVELVDHRDFIAAEYLPTFSSRAIEASLHLIPGIAEHFVAFNDDVFLMRPADFADFFGTLGCVVYLTDEALPASSDAQTLSGYNDALNARRWMLENYGRSSVNRIMEHAPRGVRKSWMDKLEQRHPQMFAEVREEKFRRSSGQSILANLYGDWCLSQGRGEVRSNQCAYLFTDALEQSPAQVAEFIAADVLGRKLSLCINDQGDDRELKRVPQALRMVMENLFTEVA